MRGIGGRLQDWPLMAGVIVAQSRIRHVSSGLTFRSFITDGFCDVRGLPIACKYAARFPSVGRLMAMIYLDYQ